jgi:hypothetical protein
MADLSQQRSTKSVLQLSITAEVESVFLATGNI